MSIKISAVKPSECENVSKKIKKRKVLIQALYRRSTISALYRGQKVNAGALHWC